MIANWLLERYLLNEVSPEEKAQIERALENDPELRGRLEVLKRDSQAIVSRYSPRVVAAEVNRRREAHAQQASAFTAWKWKAALAVPLAIAATMLLMFTMQRQTGDDIILKGDGPTLRLFRQTPTGPQRLQNAAKVRPHDVVQVEIDAVDQTSAVIISIDGAGHVTLHAAFDEAALKNGSKRKLDSSFELDDAPGFERFILVTDTRPLSTAEVMHAAEALATRVDARTANLVVSSTATTTSVLLEKGSVQP